MAVYFITGAMRSGKTLAIIDRIQRYLHQGRRVATNIDLDLNHLCRRENKWSNVIRFPDKPTLFDLEALGQGADEYDEDMFGICVFDECGTWFNPRQWNDKSRAGLISKLVHMGKMRWDCFFIMQDMSMVDKQVRGEFAEFIGMCRRLDRQKFVGVKLPKMHQCEIYYKSSPVKPVETWMYRGTDLYGAYDTEQVFRDDYEHGPFCILPPGYINKPIVKATKDRDFYMRLTKIYFRKYNRPAFLGLCAFLSSLVSAGVYQYQTSEDKALYDQLKADYEILSQSTEGELIEGEVVEDTEETVDEQQEIKILSYSKYPRKPATYDLLIEGERVRSKVLIEKGVKVNADGRCHVELDFDGEKQDAYC